MFFCRFGTALTDFPGNELPVLEAMLALTSDIASTANKGARYGKSEAKNVQMVQERYAR